MHVSIALNHTNLPLGWLWLRSAHLQTVCQVLPGGTAALLDGGPRHRRCNIHQSKRVNFVLGKQELAVNILLREMHTCRLVSKWRLKVMLFCLKALSTESIERLPVYNKSAWKHYKMSHEADDWCVPSKEPKDLSTFRTM